MQTLISNDKANYELAEMQSIHTLSLYTFIGKSVVIFGDANGLGTSMMKELLHQRAFLTLVVRTRGEQERARRELQDITDQAVMILVCDTTDKEKVRAVVAEINGMVGFIDVMINNLPHASALNALCEILPHASALNALCEILPVFCRQREGRIININADFADTVAALGLQRYNINMTTIHLSVFVPTDVAAFEILKSIRKQKAEIVISEKSTNGKKGTPSTDAFARTANLLH